MIDFLRDNEVQLASSFRLNGLSLIIVLGKRGAKSSDAFIAYIANHFCTEIFPNLALRLSKGDVAVNEKRLLGFLSGR